MLVFYVFNQAGFKCNRMNTPWDQSNIRRTLRLIDGTEWKVKHCIVDTSINLNISFSSEFFLIPKIVDVPKIVIRPNSSCT